MFPEKKGACHTESRGNTNEDHVLKCMYTNANCLSNKKTELQARIRDSQPHLIGITEVWEKEQICIDGYHPAIHKHRKDDRIGGGVLLLVRNNLSIQECDELNTSSFEDSVWCTVCGPGRREKIIVGICYRSPSSNDENNNNLISTIEMAVKKQSSAFLLMGDFNCNQINWESGVVSARDESAPSKFFHSMHDNFLYQHVFFPTRIREGYEPSKLDLIFTKGEADVEDLMSCAPLGKSDHVVLEWNLVLKTRVRYTAGRKYFNYNKGDYEGMRRYFSKESWEEMAELNVEDAWQFFKELVHVAVDEYVPKHTKKKRSTAPWWNSLTLRAVKAKHKAWKVYKESKKEEDYKLYSIQRNLTQKILKTARRKYEDNLVKKVKSEPKKLFRYIRSQQKIRPTVGTIELSTGKYTESDKEAADALQDFFLSVFVNEGTSSVPEFTNKLNEKDNLEDIYFTSGDIIKELESLDANKSTGLDDISSSVLKHCARQLVQPLKMISIKVWRRRMCHTTGKPLG